MQNIFGTQQNYGNQLMQSGGSNINLGSQFWKDILSGNPAKMSQALAPQISAIKGQTGQQVAGINQFQGRSGGTSAEVTNANAQAQTAIQNLFDMLGPTAAQQLTGIGEFQTEAGIGTLAGASGTAGELASATGSTRPGDQAIQGGQQAAVMEALVSLFG